MITSLFSAVDLMSAKVHGSNLGLAGADCMRGTLVSRH